MNSLSFSISKRAGRRIFAILAAVLALFPGPARLQSAPQPPASDKEQAQSGNRFLFIVETSKTMRPRGNAVASAIGSLLATGMQGRLQPGDSIGLWTYDRKLHAGDFPLQQWKPKAARFLNEGILKFLAGQQWEHSPNLAPVLSSLQGLVRDSRSLMVILICSGEETIKGTPFDSQINETFRSWRSEQRKQRMPFVVVMLAEHGEIVKASAAPLPWQIEIPPLPSVAAHSKAPAHSKVASKPAEAHEPAPVPPLIVSGRKKAVAEPVIAVEPATDGPAVSNETNKILSTTASQVVSSSPMPVVNAATSTIEVATPSAVSTQHAIAEPKQPEQIQSTTAPAEAVSSVVANSPQPNPPGAQHPARAERS
ncbi:MAG TPA: hypothetical protein VHH88_09965, partial [Verrucomicrobiae bacterium]|nr:hypothetical protein [Verrucomicrobiae bacterium]